MIFENERLMEAFFLLSLIVSSVCSEALRMGGQKRKGSDRVIVKSSASSVRPNPTEMFNRVPGASSVEPPTSKLTIVRSLPMISFPENLPSSWYAPEMRNRMDVSGLMAMKVPKLAEMVGPGLNCSSSMLYS